MALRKEENSFFSKRNVISLFIILIMVSSILAIWQGSTSSNTIPEYNDYEVRLEETHYVIASDFGDVSGYTYPGSLEAIPLEDSYVQYLLSSSELYILFDPQDENIPVIEVLRSELAQQDFSGLGKTVGFAVTQGNETYASYPVMSCDTTPLPTLYLHTLNTTTTRIYQDAGCIVLEAATWQDIVELKDRLVYAMYGVMG